MFLDMESRGNVLVLVRQGTVYFTTLKDLEGPKRCKDWARTQGHIISPTKK